METIRLPPQLTDAAACKAWGARVRDGAATLDWSDVAGAEPDALDALLGGMTLDAAPDGLGIDAIPDALQERVERVLRANGKPAAPTKKSKKASMPPKKPSVWKAPSDSPPASKRTRSPTPPPMRAASILASEIPPPAKIRAELLEKVLAELLGPADGEREEIVSQGGGRLRPRERYLLGLVAPHRQRVKREEVDSLEGAGTENADDDGDDETGLSSDTMFPSSLGLSFCVPVGTKLRVTARWGRYMRVASESAMTPTGEPKLTWRREPMGGTLAPFEVAEGPFGPFAPAVDQPRVVVQGTASRVAERGDVIVVSLFLVNGQDEPEERRDEGWLFQPEIVVEGEPGTAPFVGRGLGPMAHDALPTEDGAIGMMYRDHIEFAVGHGTSVNADVSAGDPRHAERVRTRTVPRYELAQMQARTPPTPAEPTGPAVDPLLAGLELDMRELAKATDPRPKLEPLLHAYRHWIDAQRARIGDPAARLTGCEEIARDNLQKCEGALEGLRRGIDLVSTDAIAGAAFRFANEAMWLQRVHTEYAEHRRRGDAKPLEAVDVPEKRSWRTFQLAFLLLTVESLTKLDHPDRAESPDALADLLWFPTGGGKTEAYLGATAYTLAVRRLQGTVAGHSGEYGVAVLMRYTLRLLTIQQFQRAAALICACESIRRGDTRFGGEPFRLGLWVGAKTTPNRTDHADEALKLERGTGSPKGSPFTGWGSPVQLKHCPWCGTTVDPGRHMRVDTYGKGAGRTLVHCGDERGACLFSVRQSPSEGIPVLVVDEEIYRRLPALLIATVDKFAQMPWNPEVQMLFGKVTGHCSRHGFRSPGTDDKDTHPKAGALPPAKTTPHAPLRPPDLIIQDELHLISGPLGTLTGLYETAVDELCTWEVNGKRVRPKILASTATVRRARQQVHALFGRALAVFPPSGLDASDNFFAVERATSEVPGRLYLGVCAQGRRLKAAMIRVYVAYLTAAQSLYQRYGRAVDPWMTLVGYFTSLRELAGTRRVVDDDVSNRAMRIDRSGLARRRIREPQELTSRLGATDIPRVLDHLELGFDPADEERRKQDRASGLTARSPIDVLLATNMISVGVDVKRLGLMVCAGQPKTTAEYIQATSRVGRQHPGIVCTIYNWARPRDLSHYESFEHYHATFYEHVEALSVTPFASRALDRGLSALLVSLVRQQGSEMNPNEAAARIDPASPAVKAAIETVRRRAELVEQSNPIAAEVARALEIRVQEWSARAKPRPGAAKLGYRTAKDGATEGLLANAGGDEWETFTCPSSLRDVETPVLLLLDEGRIEESPAATAGEAE